MNRILVALLSSLSIAMLTTAHAENPLNAQPVRIELKAFQIQADKTGKETTTEAKQARPGDLVEYRATYTNVSKATVRGLAATLPIPADMQFTGNALPAGAEASTDGKTFSAMPLKRKVADKVIDVPLAEYRALRWRVADLPAGKSAVVSARTRVNGINP